MTHARIAARSAEQIERAPCLRVRRRRRSVSISRKCRWSAMRRERSSMHSMLRAAARRHHPNPAEADRRWRGERSKPVRLGVRDHHTRSLCTESPAQTEQWVLLALPPADHLLIETDRGQFVPSRRRCMMANVRGSRQNPAPSCLSPALQLKREWSPWPEFGSDPGNPRDLSKR